MPYYLSIGVSEDRFWDGTPYDLEPYVAAHTLRLEREDHNNYNLGMYILSAVGTVIGQAFGNKKASYIEKPFTDMAKEQEKLNNLTEEDKKRYAELLFAQLGSMQHSFEREKKNTKTE